MGNEVFEALFKEKADQFRAAFSTVSREVFYDPEAEQLRHTGEYGMFREAIVRDFLKFVIPRNFDISTGFAITPMDDVSSQCDVVIFDRKMTPLYEQSDKQRFFPIESIFCIGEVKSTLHKKQELAEALNKLSEIKALGGRIENPTIMNQPRRKEFDPENSPFDLVPTVLICNDLDFNLNNIENELDDLYEPDVQHRHKHNMIFSVEDGLLSYYDSNGVSVPYPISSEGNLSNRFELPNRDRYSHFQIFSSFLFMITDSKTQLYPEFKDYVKSIRGSTYRDQS